MTNMTDMRQALNDERATYILDVLEMPTEANTRLVESIQRMVGIHRLPGGAFQTLQMAVEKVVCDEVRDKALHADEALPDAVQKAVYALAKDWVNDPFRNPNIR